MSAYRHAADAIESLDADLRSVAEAGGHAALEAIPGVGPSIAGAVAEMLSTGRWGFLERLKGAADPEALFCSVPGIGPALAHAIQKALHLDSLEALEAAAHDGRLQQVPGFGARRVTMVRSALAELLARVRPPPLRVSDEPNVGVLLDVDREYREKAASGALRKIAPKPPTRAAKPGCRSCTLCVDPGTSPRSVPTRHSRTGSGARTTGSSSFSIATPDLRDGGPS